MKVIKAGESHCEAMVGILTDVPAGVAVNKLNINKLLRERNLALGRRERQKIESDKVNLITGVRNGLTLGGNVAVVIKNAVHKNYQAVMHPFEADTQSLKITALRPGHADLPGISRWGFCDARNVMEGASARNTCIDTALGAIAISMLEELGVKIAVSVKMLGNAISKKEYSFEQNLKNTYPAFSRDKAFISACKEQIEIAKIQGESLGGVVQITVSPIKKGFGSYVPEKRVDALIAQLLMQIQAVKGVYFGENPFDLNMPATTYMGSIVKEENDLKITNSYSGGKLTVAVKPIPTTAKGVHTVTIDNGEEAFSARERADVTAVFGICPVLKAVTAIALTQAVTERLGCDNMNAIIKRYNDL